MPDNVIGFKGSKDDRGCDWLTMLLTKETYDAFKNSSDERERRIAEIDLQVYNKTLSNYIRKTG